MRISSARGERRAAMADAESKGDPNLELTEVYETADEDAPWLKNA